MTGQKYHLPQYWPLLGSPLDPSSSWCHPSCLLRDIAQSITLTFSPIFNHFLSTGYFPTSRQLTNMFKAYLFWETEKIEAFFSILPTSEVISLSLTFPRQLSFLIEFILYLSSLFHCWCTPRTRANYLAASSIRWNSCSNDHQYPSKTQLQSLSCFACLWYFIYSYGHSLIHILHVVSTQPAMLVISMCLPSWFLVLIRNRGYWWVQWVLWKRGSAVEFGYLQHWSESKRRWCVFFFWWY